MNLRQRRDLASGLLFLAPNLAGVLVFTLVPFVLSIVFAFTNWDLRLHNQFQNQPLEFVGLENFTRLLSEHEFWKYLGNTLFFMIGVPFSIAGSLVLALLLTGDMRGNSRAASRRVIAALLGVGILLAAIALLGGAGRLTTFLLLIGAGLVVGGILWGSTFYRTLFYIPHFTAGVATFVLWKKLYNPHTGPVNTTLEPVLDGLASAVNALPASITEGIGWALFLCIGIVGGFFISATMKQRSEGDTGALSLAAGIGVVSLAPIFTFFMTPLRIGAVTLLLVMVAIPIVTAMRQRGTSNFPAPRAEGMGTALLVGGMVLALQFVLLGIALVLLRLPQMAVDGLRPPGWLVDYHWSKPSLMIMAFWGAVGSNNMLLYLAGLSNVPKELYESAEIDGASGVKKFWHVTWPQLAPVTMFIVIMSVIYGLQGGFEMARTMTAGGPAGATTTLSYYVYNEGFETGRLAYAAAISWVIFALVFVLTLITWKFENRYVTD